MSKLSYAEKLKDPRWQKRRLELLEAAEWTCKQCKTKTETLHVHHGLYRRGVDPWDYEDAVMHVLCETCHASAEIGRASVYEFLAALKPGAVNYFGYVVSQIPEHLTKSILNELSEILASGACHDEWPQDTRFQILRWIQNQCASELYVYGLKAGRADREQTDKDVA